MKTRVVIVCALFLSLYGALGFKVYKLQIEKGARYIEQVEARTALRESLSIHRGSIFITDRNRNKIPVAIMKDRPVIYAVPKEIKNPSETAKILATHIGWNEDELEDFLDNPELLFRLLMDPASEEGIKYIIDEGIEGVYIGSREHRFYPFDELASQTIGFVGKNADYDESRGLYGIEKFYEEKIARGDHITLSIDRNIQAYAERSIEELRKEFDAKSGMIIVQEPKTGRIKAIADTGGFNPNLYSDSSLESFINPAVQGMYEAGSVFKPITMSAGIDSGKIEPETTYIDTGSVTLNGYTIKNWDKKSHGEVTMEDVIKKSINTGTVFAVRKTGREKFLSYVKKFGFGEISAVDLPEEVSGNIKNIGEGAKEIEVATASFGQGIAVTPMQLINAFSAIANKGIRMQPLVNNEEKPRIVNRVISEETAYKVTRMMESAVEEARVARLPSHRIAGKTGTAQIPDFKRGGYTEEFIHTYVGFGPVSKPRFVALIKLDKPNVTLAGYTVVPAFKELAQFILGYYNVPPDKDI